MPVALLSNSALYLLVISQFRLVPSRRGIAISASAALVLATMSLMPRFDVTSPRHLDKLALFESELRAALPSGINAEQAHSELKRRHIVFTDSYLTSAWTGGRGNQSIVAVAGDRLIAARIPTDAYEMFCGYDIEVVLVFGPDRRMKQQYIERFRICP